MKEPRYYQRTAINRSVAAILRGDKRLLLTLATGTGKTFVSMQIVWKLWNSGWRPGRQPADPLPGRPQHPHRPAVGCDYFVPAFGEGPVWTLRGAAEVGARDLLRALSGARGQRGRRRRDLPPLRPDFFDLVIVDECHRGSARAPSRRGARILNHFSPATQIGMTATPKRDETADSYDVLRQSRCSSTPSPRASTTDSSRRTASGASCSAPTPTAGRPTKASSTCSAKRSPRVCTRRRDFERVVSLLTAHRSGGQASDRLPQAH